ncbi:MAG: hypothetical protein ACQESP_12300, partial [Candidatus Muiribacteriota bacterium]
NQGFCCIKGGLAGTPNFLIMKISGHKNPEIIDAVSEINENDAVEKMMDRLERKRIGLKKKANQKNGLAENEYYAKTLDNRRI